MMNTKKSALVTLWANRFVMALLITLVFAMPALLRWYQSFRPLGLHGAAAVFFGFYLCVIPVGRALWKMEKLLTQIRKGQVFVPGNVFLIRSVRNCSLAVAGICGIAGCFYQPLLFLFVIMGFLTLVLSVVTNVIAAAVEIREENDLTV